MIASAAALGIGLSISGLWGETFVFYAASLFCLLSFLLTCAFCTSSDSGKTTDEAAANQSRLRLSDIIAPSVAGYAATGGIYSFSNGIISAYLALYAKELGIANIGIYYTINAIVLFVIRPVSGRLMDKKGLGPVAFPALQTACIKRLGTEKSGVATSTFYLGGDIGQGMGPMIAGVAVGLFLNPVTGYRIIFSLCGVLFLVGFLLLCFIQREERR